MNLFETEKECRCCSERFNPISSACWYFCSKGCCESDYDLTIEGYRFPGCIGCMGQVMTRLN